MDYSEINQRSDMAIKDLIITSYVKTYSPYRGKGRRISGNDAIRMCQMYVKGLTFEEIAIKSGWSIDSVKSVVRNPRPYTFWSYTPKQKREIEKRKASEKYL